MANHPELSVIIPLKDEAGILPQLRQRLSSALDPSGIPYEVIAVNDGSGDSSPILLRQFHLDNPRWKTIDLARNFGHGAACTAGLDHASGDAVVFMDADLQDPPEVILEFVQKWREGYDVVYGVRTRRTEGRLRQWATGCFYRLLAAFSDTPLPVNAGIFSLLDRKAAQALKSLPERHRYLTGLRTWVGFKQIGVPYAREARLDRSPKQTLHHLLRLSFDAMFSFSNIPLRIATLMGLSLALCSFLLAANVLYERLFTNKPILGWSSVMISITLIGGMILFTMGVLGEYVGRMYDEIKHRPIYIVRDRVGFD